MYAFAFCCLCNAVRLEWKPSDESDVLYAASINVYCTDRKYLLSDVSIVVSRETMIQVTHHYSSVHYTHIHCFLFKALPIYCTGWLLELSNLCMFWCCDGVASNL
jgi:hypothetical protein